MDTAAPLDDAARSAALRLARARDDLRRGEPVFICGEDGAGLLILAIEQMTADMQARLTDIGLPRPFILLSAARARALAVNLPEGGGAIIWPEWISTEQLIGIADPVYDLSEPMKGPFRAADLDSDRGHLMLAQTAIGFLKSAALLPAGLCVPANAAQASLLECFSISASQAHAARLATDVTRVVSAQVPLDKAEECRVHAFRGGPGQGEHLALVIGNPDLKAPVLVRLHSECLTGDVLGSLKCDCGAQLKGAIAAIAERGSGILLYLAQEGRNIGLMNKLRAYSLQDQGFDTVDANLRLGFGNDERTYGLAAQMLLALGVRDVELMTNNPLKSEALEANGVHVAARLAHKFPSNVHNEGYLRTKRDRSGHDL